MVGVVQSGFHEPPFSAECRHECGFVQNVADVAFGAAARKQFESEGAQTLAEQNARALFSRGERGGEPCRSRTDDDRVKAGHLRYFRTWGSTMPRSAKAFSRSAQLSHFRHGEPSGFGL